MILVLLSGCTLYGKEPVIEESHYEEEYVMQDTTVYQTAYDFENMTLSDIVQEVMEEYHLNEQNFAMFYENSVTHEYYGFNEDSLMIGASTIKVLVNKMFYDFNYDIDETYLIYRYEDYEAGAGNTAIDYMAGDYIPLSYLMKESLVNSDNTAINIMIDELGFYTVREALAAYSDVDYDTYFYADNLISAQLLHGVIQDIYEHSDEYEDIIKYMKEAMPDRYMKTYVDEVSIAHKYGEFGTVQHDFGIVYTNQPIFVGILTDNCSDGEEVIAYLTRVLYEYAAYHENRK